MRYAEKDHFDVFQKIWIEQDLKTEKNILTNLTLNLDLKEIKNENIFKAKTWFEEYDSRFLPFPARKYVLGLWRQWLNSITHSDITCHLFSLKGNSAQPPVGFNDMSL